MDLLRFSVLALLCVAVAANDETTSLRSAEECWRSLWPHTPMPKNLEYLLGSGANKEENKDTQYPHTSFFESDLHGGKKMNIQFHISSSNKEQRSNALEKDTEKSSSSQLRGVHSWKRNAMKDEDLKKSANPIFWGIGTGKRDATDEDLKESANPIFWGTGTLKRNTVDDEDLKKSANPLPWGASTRKTDLVDDEDLKKSANPIFWGTGTRKTDTMDDEDLKKSANPIFWGTGTRKTDVVDYEYLKDSANPIFWGTGMQKRDPMAKHPVDSTLEAICDTKERFVGEDGKYCAKSVESLLDFVISKLGKDIEGLSSSFVPHQTQYTILEGIQRVSSEGVMCHKLNYHTPIFYCHQVNATVTYIVPMEAADGTRTSVVALCHRDTRGLDAHKLFHKHKVMPGTVPICHFLGTGSITWVPRNNQLKATC